MGRLTDKVSLAMGEFSSYSKDPDEVVVGDRLLDANGELFTVQVIVAPKSDSGKWSFQGQGRRLDVDALFWEPIACMK